jgi:hypothetical protein
MRNTTIGNLLSAAWRIGQRVSRKNTKELGTIVVTDGTIKVKWDSAERATSAAISQPILA